MPSFLNFLSAKKRGSPFPNFQQQNTVVFSLIFSNKNGSPFLNFEKQKMAVFSLIFSHCFLFLQSNGLSTSVSQGGHAASVNGNLRKLFLIKLLTFHTLSAWIKLVITFDMIELIKNAVTFCY